MMAMDEILMHPAALVMAGGYGTVALTSVPASYSRSRLLLKICLGLLVACFVVNTGVIADRWIESGRPPFKTLYETLLFYPWCVSLVTLVLIGLYRLYILIPFTAVLNVGGIIYGLRKPDIEIINLPPALQSAWFVPHVVTYFVSYATLFASCVLAVMSLYTGRGKQGSTPDSEKYAESANLTVRFGFAALTLGLALGSMWGKAAWGDYWTWDPKENWALITWLLYLVYLHLRYVRGLHGKRSMAVLVMCFAAVVFTYLGMNLLPTAENSLHVYQ